LVRKQTIWQPYFQVHRNNHLSLTTLNYTPLTASKDETATKKLYLKTKIFHFFDPEEKCKKVQAVFRGNYFYRKNDEFKKMLASKRVTRLGKIRPLGECLLWAIFNLQK
jgi:hypothetical protein